MAEGGGTVSWLSGGNDSSKVSVGFVIEYSGRTVQMLGLDETNGGIRVSAIRTTNDGNGLYGVKFNKAVLGTGWSNPNNCTIQVEFEGYAAKGPNAAQIASWVKLVKDLKAYAATYKRLKLRGALGHRDFQSYKACPGTTQGILTAFKQVGGHGLWASAPSPTPAPATGDTVKSFPVPEKRTLASVKTGAWLYDNSDLAPSSGNVQISPGRNMPYIGQFTSSPDVRIVAYEPTGPDDTNVQSKAMFTPASNISAYPLDTLPPAPQPVDTTPYSQLQYDQAKAAASKTGYNEGLDAAGVAIHNLPRR